MGNKRQRTPATAEEREEREQARTDKLEALHETLTSQVAALVDGDAWQRMLRAAATFHRYSFGNVCAILAQRPDASQVAGFHTWRKLGRTVNKGEHGIAILAPVTYAADRDDEQPNEGPAPRRLRGFKIEHVFDVSQTSGDPLPEVGPRELEGDAPAELWEGLASQVEGEGYTLRRGECQRPSARGDTDPATRTVTVREDLQLAQACKTLAHELAHIRLGHVNDLPTYRACRGPAEIEAESVAYMVCAEAGLDSTDYSVAYAAGWANGDVAAIRATAEKVITIARSITDALEPYPIAM
jgi:antirestriction protein ArdC